jgi:hypothetical protein
MEITKYQIIATVGCNTFSIELYISIEPFVPGQLDYD